MRPTRIREKEMKNIFAIIGILFALVQFAMAQTIVVLNVPDPCSETGVEESFTSDFDFGVFPNPADDAVTLSFSNADPIGKVEVQVTDMHGAVVIRKQYYSAFTELRTEMALGKLSPGVYTISARGKEIYSVKKLIIKK